MTCQVYYCQQCFIVSEIVYNTGPTCVSDLLCSVSHVYCSYLNTLHAISRLKVVNYVCSSVSITGYCSPDLNHVVSGGILGD